MKSLFFSLIIFIPALSCGGNGTSTDSGCKQNSDCPSDRYVCNTELGICVGQTNDLGDTDITETPDATDTDI